MTGGACGTALTPPQIDIVLVGATYSMTATELNSNGYYYTLCYSCDIKPTGLPIITFNYKDLIIVEALALDCSNSLVDKSFPNPATIYYNSAGSAITVINGYSDIFTHT